MSDEILQESKSPTFNSHLSQTPPEWLFHYTTQSGLIGIVRSAELWATKVQYMNDSTEFGLALDLATERTKQIYRTTTDKDVSQKIAGLFTRRDGIANVNLFVACFCEDGDLLSQWRGYSGSSHGFSLGMRTETLVMKAKAAGFDLGKCVYDRTEQITIIDELIYSSLGFETDLECAAAFERGLLRVGAFFKHEKFVDEHEWRIVSRVTSVRDDRVGFREGMSMPIPHYRLAIGEGKDSAIKYAIVGPCPHPALSKSSVEMLLFQYGLRVNAEAIWVTSYPDVRISSVPYRNW